MVLLYDPSAARPRARGNGVTLDTLAGKVVGFIDNAKPNFDHLVDELGRLLVAEYGVARVVKRRKPSASVPAEPQVVAALAAECDLVIAGSGD
ncbi:MAG TPA: hypothetical protein VFZ14_00950 [Burkholderiales bacterium]|nr:hypothetical protein [Burkholderiales bacterium]